MKILSLHIFLLFYLMYIMYVKLNMSNHPFLILKWKLLSISFFLFLLYYI